MKKSAHHNTSGKSASTSPWNKAWLVVIPLFAFFLYAESLRFGYNGDDDAVTRGNSSVQEGISGIGKIFTTGYYDGFRYSEKASRDKLYRPFPLVHFAVEHEIWGNNPAVGHTINVAYYAVCCLLLFFLLNILLARHTWVPALITLLFAAHPVHTEVVANIKSRDEILCLMFCLLTLLAILKYAHTRSIPFLVATTCAYALALLSKENAVTLLALTPLVLFYSGRALDKKLWMATLLPLAAVTIVYISVRGYILGTLVNRELDIIDNSLLAATSFTEMLATNFVILWEYLRLLFFPHPLSWDYSYNQIPLSGFSNPVAIFSLLLHALLLVYALFSLRRKNWVAFGILFYFITLSVSSNLVVRIASTLAERFLFLPSIGFCVAVVISAETVLKKISHSALRNTLAVILFSLLLAAYSYKTIRHSAVWRDPLSLLQAGVIASPNSARAHLFLGHEYMAASLQKSDRIKQTMDMRKAINCYLRSAEIAPAYGGALNSLGSAYHALGMPDSALFFLRKISKQDKEFPKTCYNLGDVWFSLRNADSALHYFLKVPPDDISYGLACNSIGFIYARQNRTDDAIARLKQVRPANPSFGKACNNIGKLYLNLSQPDSALHYFLLVPETDNAIANARLNAGNIYLQKKSYRDALALFQKINFGDGTLYRDAQFLSGKVFFEQGNADAALVALQKAVAFDPSFKPAYEALTTLHEALGNKEMADYYSKMAAGL